MDISQTGGEQHPELGQNWAGTEEGLERPRIGSERTLKENVNWNRIGNSLVPDDYKMVKNDVQKLRRSVSMGHLSVAGAANFSPVEGVGNSVQSLPNSGHNRHRLRRWLSCDGDFLY
ncbi:putative ring finger protein [Tripterygium wilfordii]|uniref:Putative ring finger protein n=2 Tax=Tripterygium wilfordii TaxID=458696 RepID=A0A7J7D1G4_TRIWF|nr:putative ring finger protein [Tripterygium wilfordii]